jgi:hypothetical protein
MAPDKRRCHEKMALIKDEKVPRNDGPSDCKRDQEGANETMGPDNFFKQISP